MSTSELKRQKQLKLPAENQSVFKTAPLLLFMLKPHRQLAATLARSRPALRWPTPQEGTPLYS